MIEREESMRVAATMYYLQDEPMDAIARRLGTSRSTVSRLLKADAATGVAAHLLARFGIRAHVVPVRARAQEVERLDQVANVAARLLMDLFDDEMVLGVAWGTTVSAVARALGRKPTHSGTVVQLNGAANTVTSGVDYASTIVTAYGAAFDAEVRHFPVPAFFDFADTREAMWRERSVQRVLAVQQRADIALFGVGALGGQVPSHVYSSGYLDESDLAALYASGVVGDVCTVFLRQDGSYRDIAINRRATGPTPAELARIPRRPRRTTGEAKLRPLLAALRAGTVTDLIIDEPTARRLVPGPRPR
jgi:deoxyribonucleoside regulator